MATERDALRNLAPDRIAESAFKVELDRERLYEGEHLDALLGLAEHVGIGRVIGL